MKNKIIHILCHSLENNSTRDYHVFGNWTARLAKNVVKYTDKYQNEVWYAVRHLNKMRSFSKDGITYRLFPAWSLHPALESYFAVVRCDALFNQLKSENPKNTIIHFQGERGTILHTLLSRFPQFKITVQYHGYGQPPWLEWMERLLIYPLEKENFPKAAHFFVHIRKRIRYLIHDLKIPLVNVNYQNVGIDFNLFKPRNKLSLRKKLGLPETKFIILYVGHMIATKGVDKIITAYKTLKNKYPQLYLFFVGAEKSDPLYHQAVKTADMVKGIIDNKILPYYYNAADLFCFFGDRKTTVYAGPTTALMEALASNLNAISTNLIQFPDKIKNKIGIVPKNITDFIEKIEFFINHPDFKFNPRSLVAKYTDYKYQTTYLLKIYDKLLSGKA